MSAADAVFELDRSVPRDADAVKCDCGGYAESVKPTAEEEKEFGCGRSGCCARAFVCAICGARIIGAAEAPEME